MYRGDLKELSPLRITSVGRYFSSPGLGAAYSGQSGSIVAAIAANTAIYVPMWTPVPLTVARMFWNNGSNTTGNADAGVYDASGTKLVSTGSTARSGTSACQYVDVTDTIVPAGRFWLALACNNGSSSFRGTRLQDVTQFALNYCRIAGIVKETSAFPLPSSMTPVALTAAMHPTFGFSQDGTL